MLQEARWLLLGGAAVYLALILFGYRKSDPGWSQATIVGRVSNPGGRFGAWLADLLLYVFGMSAWWCVVFLLFLVVWGYRRLDGFIVIDRRPFLIASTGFLVLLAASSGLEAMRFYTSTMPVPLAPGGMFGVEVSRLVSRSFGFTGGTLLLIGLFVVGLSLFTGLSWLNLAERVGAGLEHVWFGAANAWQDWRDRRMGREVAEKREAVVEVERKRIEEEPPVHIEPPVTEVPKSARRDRERQQPLFRELPGGALPPLVLLDEPPHDGEPPSAETLEFT